MNGLKKYAKSNVHFWPQSKYIVLGDSIAIDYIGRIESIQKDFNKICDVLGLNKDLPHRNKSQTERPVRRYYTSDATKRVVEEIYGEDFNRLNYERSLKK